MTVLSSTNWNFSKDNKIEAKAKPGEIVIFKTKDCFDGQVTSEDMIREELNMDHTNPTAGPLYIEGAERGDILVVDILDIDLADQGVVCTFHGEGCLSDVAELRTKIFKIDNGYSNFKDIEFQLDPMIGVIGTMPDEDISCGYAWKHGGNMDSKMIKKGTRVYLPVYKEGALLQMGDVHANMGDGEACGTGIEIGAEITVKVDLIKNTYIEWPVTETRDYWYVNSVGPTYGESYLNGSRELARLMEKAYGWDVTDIFMYMSVRGTVEINQGDFPDPCPMITLRVGVPKTKGKELLKK